MYVCVELEEVKYSTVYQIYCKLHQVKPNLGGVLVVVTLKVKRGGRLEQ